MVKNCIDGGCASFALKLPVRVGSSQGWSTGIQSCGSGEKVGVGGVTILGRGLAKGDAILVFRWYRLKDKRMSLSSLMRGQGQTDSATSGTTGDYLHHPLTPTPHLPRYTSTPKNLLTNQLSALTTNGPPLQNGKTSPFPGNLLLRRFTTSSAQPPF